MNELTELIECDTTSPDFIRMFRRTTDAIAKEYERITGEKITDYIFEIVKKQENQ